VYTVIAGLAGARSRAARCIVCSPRPSGELEPVTFLDLDTRWSSACWRASARPPLGPIAEGILRDSAWVAAKIG